MYSVFSVPDLNPTLNPFSSPPTFYPIKFLFLLCSRQTEYILASCWANTTQYFERAAPPSASNIQHRRGVSTSGRGASTKNGELASSSGVNDDAAAAMNGAPHWLYRWQQSQRSHLDADWANYIGPHDKHSKKINISYYQWTPFILWFVGILAVSVLRV